ncbi:Tyrosine-protein phosphatase YwqE [Pedobacter sp. Bi27]|uniref:tyrosine-protein phosphatase n=1 Tax=unclassified Pedobacter TaxID=2628915 RepID=UPI001D24EACA|nr:MULTISPECIES: CpsB/CapC family capsule biosynthesis tyrosine phosphatase [unclassified Pedobacter]CAH0198493.1 Tyrosine-protein phosphatase YwqE [Pedobacter sp. Bi36]CAH0254063.1 Tyrosine-protein phosphatase YwqE [Pedobacter sp. Bi126]CAH0308245.1 Tyrosine-protein phosphatase YwqE [Pedobacter sp. Bi27]
MLSFFNRKNKVTDISWLGVDMHSHILPGIDDGSPDVATSLRFVKSLQELGFDQLICTPHIYRELYPNTVETISAAKAALQEALDKENILFKLGAGAEYMIDQDFSLQNELCPLDQKHLLIEMSYLNESPSISQTIFDIEIKGYKPILAHPERYTFYFRDITRLKRFKEKGCLLQLNLLSVLGYYGKDVKQLAEVLLKEKMYDLAGTDLHHDKHLNVLKESILSGKLYDIIGSYSFKNQELFSSILV